MTQDELAALKGMLVANPFDFTIPAAEVRAQFNGAVATFPVDESFSFTETKIGGVPGLWMDAPGSSNVLLYVHGGAMLVGTAEVYRGLSGNLAAAAGVNHFSIDYRLAPENQYPAALDDVVSAYKGLLLEGYQAENIVVAGDSAGGGLVLALLLTLKATGAPQPAAAVVLSPWADLTHSGETMTTMADKDVSLTKAGLESGARQYAGAHPLTDSLLSPVFGDLGGVAPLLIEVGTTEILLSDSTRVRDNAQAGGTEVTFHAWNDMPHDWSLFSFMLSEGRDMIDEVGAWIKTKVA